MATLCNPLNLEYKYQHMADYSVNACREAADPTLVNFKGKYYLFPSMSGGFWYSDDLLNWQFREESTLMYDYAPDVHPVGDMLYFCASTRGKPCEVYATSNPLRELFHKIGEADDAWDPAMFLDDDGKLYLYSGCSNQKPSLHVQQIDPKTCAPQGKKKGMFGSNTAACGWERTETFKWEPKTTGDKILAKLLGPEPFIEGAFMIKKDGRYYLHYAAPATEQPSYGNGIAVGTSPMGPFVRQAHNPVSLVPGGFFRAAGHGSTMRDNSGNYWHIASMRISVNAKFERRLGLFPCGFDSDGIFFCNQEFADYPREIPAGSFDPRTIKPKWMLLSYGKKASASSCLDEAHIPQYGVDEDVTTSWCAATPDSGQWYMVDLGQTRDVRAIQVNFADVNIPNLRKPKQELKGSYNQKRFIDMSPDLKTCYLLEVSEDGKNWLTILDNKNAMTNRGHEYCEIEQGVQARYVRVIGQEFPYGSCMAISGLRVFGNGYGAKPEPVSHVRCQRKSLLDAQIRWDPCDGAQGYNVRWGIAPDKLYSSWLLYGQNTLHLPFLNAEQQEYYFAVDAFNENGITPGNVCKL